MSGAGALAERHEGDAAVRAGRINVGEIERLVSVVGGAALVLNALARPSLLRGLLAVGGAALIQRGATGHCALYNAFGLDTSGERETVALEPRFRPRGRRSLRDEVELASDHSFPASDPPAWVSSSAVGRPD